jgi:hypothetical protein
MCPPVCLSTKQLKVFRLNFYTGEFYFGSDWSDVITVRILYQI